MNENEKLFRALGGVGEDLIARADEPVTKTGAKVWYRVAALAACAALIIGVSTLVIPKLGSNAKSAEPAATDLAEESNAMDMEPEAMQSAPAEAPEEPKIAEPLEPDQEDEKVLKPTSEETLAEQVPVEEPPEEEPKEQTEEEDNTPDPDPLNRLNLFDQKYHYVSKTQAKNREAVFDDEKIGPWWSVLFSGEDVYRYGDETVTGTDGKEYPAQIVVIYGKRTAAIYEYDAEQELPKEAESE